MTGFAWTLNIFKLPVLIYVAADVDFCVRERLYVFHCAMATSSWRDALHTMPVNPAFNGFLLDFMQFF